MKKGDKAIITNRSHKDYGTLITISYLSFDNQGRSVYFYRDNFGRDVAISHTDIHIKQQEEGK